MYNDILETINNLNKTYQQTNFKFVNTVIKGDNYVTHFNIAGFDKSEIKIEFTKKVGGYNRQIKIIAENKEFGISKQFTEVPSTIDEKSVKAVLKNGILTISCCEEKVKSPLASLTIQVE
jgi:HSP20 family molecular chaperone IbpA